jgi:hypothetical protein
LCFSGGAARQIRRKRNFFPAQVWKGCLSISGMGETLPDDDVDKVFYTQICCDQVCFQVVVMSTHAYLGGGPVADQCSDRGRALWAAQGPTGSNRLRDVELELVWDINKTIYMVDAAGGKDAYKLLNEVISELAVGEWGLQVELHSCSHGATLLATPQAV